MKKIKNTAAALLALIFLSACSNAAAETAAPTPEKTAEPAAISLPEEYIYCVGSVSKIYSTAAVMLLVDEGKVSLDAPVTEYIPDFKMADERYKDITVRMLMDHTSGIKGSSMSNWVLYNDNDPTRHDHLLEMLSKQTLRNDPGKFASYCNDGFDLLEIITENVSGMSYTEYLRSNMSDVIGTENTGTAMDMFGNEMFVPAVAANGQPMEKNYSLCIGAGGVYSSARDTNAFGETFFTGNDTLVSEEGKTSMGTRWSDDEYGDASGLGWDFTDLDRYSSQGVKVVMKGGDSGLEHAFLTVAPDENISVTVMSSGGSSTFNAMVTEALLDAALAEKGITATDVPFEEYEIIKEVPDEYLKYEGFYLVAGEMGETICEITFPEKKYLHMKEISSKKTTCTDCAYTSAGDFVKLAYEVEQSNFDTRPAPGNYHMSFDEKKEDVFIKASLRAIYPGLGVYDRNSYVGQRLEENEVSEDVMDFYRSLEGHDILVTGDKYSSDVYDHGVGHIKVINELHGYVFGVFMGGDQILKAQSAERLTSPNIIPSSSSRDPFDLNFKKEGNTTAVYFDSGISGIMDNSIPDFDESVKSVTIGENAEWYKISDSIANSSVTVTRPENSAIYVYNRFDEVIYTTHSINARPQIPMPRGGKVLFLGEPGSEFGITA